MLKKVAINKNEIDKLIRMKKNKEAFEYIEHVRNVIELVAISRVDQFIKNKIILEKEREVFISLIQNNINNKLLEEKNYILIDETYISSLSTKIERFKELRERRKVTNK